MFINEGLTTLDCEKKSVLFWKTLRALYIGIFVYTYITLTYRSGLTRGKWSLITSELLSIPQKSTIRQCVGSSTADTLER